ncbi:hypothetical protein [Lunatibacter salilacus]|uniref:hypothetical protein n=1 Tax=Lunatibacter salilacus TaxID=2483804 RepID=UPI00131C8F37|nr:hypothetical protein [Lunatibacter salilacus]
MTGWDGTSVFNLEKQKLKKYLLDGINFKGDKLEFREQFTSKIIPSQDYTTVFGLIENIEKVLIISAPSNFYFLKTYLKVLTGGLSHFFCLLSERSFNKYNFFYFLLFKLAFKKQLITFKVRFRWY